jgi:hypothetical protein
MSEIVDITAAAGALLAAAFTAWAAKSASDAAKTAKLGVAGEHKPILIDVPYEMYTDYEHEIPWPTQTVKSAWRGEIFALIASAAHSRSPFATLGAASPRSRRSSYD